MLEKAEKKEMIRYGRNKNNNRNSLLFTFREGEFVFFGVSRCSRGDVFDRERGLEIAKGRAIKAATKLSESSEVALSGELAFTRETTAGYVAVSEVPLLLNWFRALNS